MPVFNLFSKRQKQLRGETVDIYFYDRLPDELRVQVVHIIRDTIGENYDFSTNPYNPYKSIHETLCREYGLFTLSTGKYREGDEESVLNFLLQTPDIEKAIDTIELFFQFIKNTIDGNNLYKQFFKVKLNPIDAISELNYRFKEHGFGYQFEHEMIRVDSTYIHSEVVKPTISLLNKRKFAGANEEYLKAHEHYRHRRNKECLTECLKAFESTMKIICIEKGWPYNETDPAKKLIQICFQNGLVPTFTQNQFTSLQNLLESGIPPLRNKLGGHGQGQTPTPVDDKTTRYGLNLTGSNIIFLIEQSNIN
ncbi:STM4504/CBY_0614 family protein [Mucilaginibacter lappiensis]|uniref:Abortive infection C-terminus n=1 Tax=Mucilaginibacter lappiensis TaxID=354630 RepID=A0A841JPP7_9SPHI|nr:hypothetical protein [Mucilaginibacter lappiensis]MBB6130285.1 hypothetical protein [Mucilaginibacter lappiensis]